MEKARGENVKHDTEETAPVVVLVARDEDIAELIRKCARKELPFSGPNSLCSIMSARGYKTTSLYDMVRAAELEP